MRSVVLGLAVVLCPGLAVALPTARIAAVRTAAAPVLDGVLDDEAWTRASPSRAFTQRFPDEGAPPSEGTEVRVLYDDQALYIGIDCEQLQSPLALQLTRRDRFVEADQVRVAISSRRDRSTAFEFGVTASGVLSDGIYFDDDEYSRTWDENWEAQVSKTERGWSAELRIPVRVLRFDPLPVQDWGFNVSRFISARQETQEWAFRPRTVAGVVSHFGTLENLVGLQRPHPFELRPFALGEISSFQPGFGPQQGLDPRLSAGLDLKAHPTQNLTLDVAVNPDFGQVEADEVILNLGTLETQHPEKRPFFLEGTDIFPRRVLYTRRIGSVPGSPARGMGEALVERPRPTPIYGAVKLVGRPLPWLALGALSAVTGVDHQQVRLLDGQVADRLAVPTAAYNALRLRADFGSRGHVGLVASTTNRFEDPTAYPVVVDPLAGERRLCPSGARVLEGQRCLRDAYVAGLDARWRSRSLEYSLNGTLMASLLHGGPDRPQRDGTVLRSGDLGPIWSLVAAKEGGQHWLGDVGLQVTGRHADTNDLGFQERQNEVRNFANLAYRTMRPWGPTLETRTGVQSFQQFNIRGLLLTRLVQLYSDWRLGNFWEVEGRFIWSPAAFDDREVGDGTALERPGRLGGQLQVVSDPRGTVVAEMNFRGEWLRGGGRYAGSGLLKLRLFPPLELDLGPELTYRSGEPRFLERQSADTEITYHLGQLRAASVGTVLRLTWTFTPRLTLQAYAQLFLLERRYSDFTLARAAAPGGLIRLQDLAPAAAPPDDPNEREGVINTNLLLRWEYRLGSVLYLVYTRSQVPLEEAITTGQGSLDLRPLTRGPAANTILLKLSYWCCS